jgi:sec-independent protein translocase protein TatC
MTLVPFPAAQSPLEPSPDDRDRRRVDEDEDTGAAGGKMSFLEHLDELRKRLVISIVSLFVGFLVCLVFISPIFEFIMRPLTAALPAGGTLIYNEPAEAFLLWIKMAALAGLVLAFPVILSQVWLFVAPGLYAHEKKLAVPFVLFATTFFISGVLFSHFLLFPWAWRFFASFGTDYLTFLPRIGPAFSLYVKLLLACGVIFQLPTVVFFLARVGVVTHRFLIRNTKYAILIIFIVAALLTPSPDPVTQTMMAAPMIALYGISILIAWVFGRASRER